MPVNNGSRMNRVHRIVIHPDWQGIGLASKFLNTVVSSLGDKTPTYLQTSSLPMKNALAHSDKWVMTRNSKTTKAIKNMMGKTWRPVKTATFKYRRNFGKNNR